MPRLGLDDVARHFERVGTPDAQLVARILSGVGHTYFLATAGDAKRQHALLVSLDKLLHPATGSRARAARSAVAQRPHEVLLDARGWIGALLAGQQAIARESSAIFDVDAVLNLGVLDHAIGVVRAFGLDVDGVRPKLARELRLMARSADSRRLDPEDAPRILERALIVAGMTAKRAHEVTTILRRKVASRRRGRTSR